MHARGARSLGPTGLAEQLEGELGDLVRLGQDADAGLHERAKRAGMGRTCLYWGQERPTHAWGTLLGAY